MGDEQEDSNLSKINEFMLPVSLHLGTQFHSTGLTSDSISEMPDEEIESTVTGTILSKVDYSQLSRLDSLRNLTEGERIIYLTTDLEGEVYSGGFHQYFVNSNGELAEDAFLAYIEIAAKKHAAITAKALELARLENDLRDSIKASSNKLKAFSESYKQTKLSDLDNLFYALEKTRIPEDSVQSI